ncbi:NTP transferase domain-containing protein [Alloacidobacterium dinghuense]|uniref:NTP transferase domain-containing protein n=1 Tax=Alloacidobacterium dinghuense TaxID=2763107 RepID=A0A7G8BLM6_9BACT|nr:NTP transferase domain-containing protein [Alloacidobacterium dinghuense]QNI33446.1 NTP transferase domain-containing protein [Alloacidobacterium dinghuense]
MKGTKHSSSLRRRGGRKIHECLILAAGNGSRIVSLSGGLPKPLVKVKGQSLLEHVMLAARDAGIDRFVVVVGYGAGVMRAWLDNWSLQGISITVVENPDYHKDNGISVLKAHRYLEGPFLLLMADHIFEPDMARALLRQPLIEGDVILAVDSKLNRIFDLDDATKVRREGGHVVDIGKQITAYDGYDTGMFLCSARIFDALESATQGGNCSLSDGMRLLGKTGSLRAFDIGKAAWQDVDTPEALAHAETILDRQFRHASLHDVIHHA